MSIEEQISELIGKYEGLDAHRLKQFNEENTKKDFILPLFKHLGWDVTISEVMGFILRKKLFSY